jgi:hypothetical protein
MQQTFRVPYSAAATVRVNTADLDEAGAVFVVVVFAIVSALMLCSLRADRALLFPSAC